MSDDPFRPFLAGQGFVLLDGGLATALEGRGHLLDSDLWSARLLIDDPDAIRDAHRAYLEAGADCITTASYQASFEGFAAIGCGRREAERLLRSSTRLAVEARDAFWAAERGPASGRLADVGPAAAGRSDDRRLRPLVAASVGPYGAFLADGSEYDGRYGIDAAGLRDFHLRRFEVLADTEADLLACETIPSVIEAEVLLRILDEVSDAWAWLSFSCRDTERLNDGSPLADAVRACGEHERVVAVGVNCTAPGFVGPLLEAARPACTLPLIAYPNSGESYDAERKRWSGRGAPEAWVRASMGWLEAGARVLGGCCRVGPDEIRALRLLLTRQTPQAEARPVR